MAGRKEGRQYERKGQTTRREVGWADCMKERRKDYMQGSREEELFEGGGKDHIKEGRKE